VPTRNTLRAILIAFGCLGAMAAQEAPIPQLAPGSARKPVPTSNVPRAPTPPQSVALSVPKGTPLQVALDQEIRVKKVGQPIHGRIVEPVYAFDHIVIPVGSEVAGQVTKIGTISGGKRTMAALDADFTPVRTVEVNFHHLVLADGRRFQLQANVAPGSGQVIRFVAAAEGKEKRKGVKDAASEKTKQAKEQAKQEWDNAMKQLKTPGRMHRLKRYVEAQLPIHPQYIPAGTVYFAELTTPLDFGTELMTPQMAASLGGPLPPGSVVHARLVTPLTSATTQKGEAVEAVMSQPLLDGERHLILPQGSRLKGTVRQVQPARRMKKNGQLRIAFQQLIPPDGMEQKVEATLEGVQSGKDANVKLDPEGGAEATTPKTRYLATAISLTLAAASVRSDQDVDHGVARGGGDASARAAGGLGGFKLVGMALGVAVHSRPLGYTMGAYGAGMSLYSHFVARGNDVVFPKDTAMEIGIGTRQEGSGPTSAPERVPDAKAKNPS
jgi:type IV secretory pathway VirB10-like protein